MKKQAWFIAFLIVIGALFGSFFTYNYYIQHGPPIATASPPKTSPEGPKTVIIDKKNGVIGSNSVVDAVKKLGPSVVYITTKATVSYRDRSAFPPGFPDEFREFFTDPYENLPKERQGSGSGIIISPDGLILTNQHVIDGAETITVKIASGDSSDDEKTYSARVIGEDRLTDIAVIKVDATNLPAAVLGDSDSAQIGEWVIAVGNPYGYEHTVTVGVLSGKGRDLTDTGMGREYPNLLQTDAAINPGNSGGPLANLKGEVIGVNTAILRYGQGIGFAIPINRIKDIEEQLVSRGKVVRPYIGIQMMEIDEAKAKYLGMPTVEGVIVYRVLKNSPAEKAGLKRGDVILEIDGKKVNKPKDLQEILRKYKVGQTADMKVWQNKEKIDVKLLVGEMPTKITE